MAKSLTQSVWRKLMMGLLAVVFAIGTQPARGDFGACSKFHGFNTDWTTTRSADCTVCYVTVCDTSYGGLRCAIVYPGDEYTDDCYGWDLCPCDV